MNEKDRERERAEKMKALRRELEEKLEDQLPAEMLEGKPEVEVRKIREGEELEPGKAKRIIEALLFASTKPITVNEIRKVMKALSPKDISNTILELKQEYEREPRSFEVVEIANGFEVRTKKDYAPWIMKIELQKKVRQVTQSALETLAILAYKQPITRPEIEELRGVDVSGVLTTLMERGLVKIVGKKEVAGRPFLYGTTDKFLEHFGLNRIEDLPPIEEIKNLVENSVNKDELLGTTKILDIPNEENTASESGEASPQGESLGPQEEDATVCEGQNESEPDTQEDR
ncbi:MAG: SMC-Scp complex subunit ScpB [Candidatus Omnitrophica bacterium]|nr:SMC-Scp complex subunit ScpB [Candidatus Omnitrophota bacterium]